LDEGAALLSIGSVLDERYRIERVIGRGGMGAVYEAVRLDLGRRVAIKILAAEGDALAATEREARAAAQLAHPHIVQVFDFSRGENGDPPYFVMELLEGESLADRIAQDGPLEPGTAALVLVQVLSALGAAHGSGILHRDVKPANVFLGSTAAGFDFVKLLDFGVAWIAPRSPASIRRYAEPVGTPAYMAPEQIRGEALDERTDVWAAGVCLYEMLSGTAPFDAENVASLLVKVCEGDPVPIELRSPGIDPGLARIVHRALARERAGRFSSAAEMRSALARYATTGAVPSRESPFGARRAVNVASTTVAAPPATMPLAATTPAPAARTLASTEIAPARRSAWGLALGLLAVVAIGWKALPRPEPAIASAEGCRLHAPLDPWLAGVEEVRVAATASGVSLSAVTLDGQLHTAGGDARAIEEWPGTVLTQSQKGDRFFPCATVSEDKPMGGGIRVRPTPGARALFMQHGKPLGEAAFIGGVHLRGEPILAEEAACAASGPVLVFATYNDAGGTGELHLVLSEGGVARRTSMNVPGSDGLLVDVHEATIVALMHQSRRVTAILFDRASLAGNLSVIDVEVDDGNMALALGHDGTDVVWKPAHSDRIDWRRMGQTGMALRDGTLARGNVFAPRISRSGDGVAVAWGERRADRTYLHVGTGPTPVEAAARARPYEVAPDARGLALAGGPRPWLAWIAGEGTAANVRAAPVECK
jgi:hypothetical protein